MNHSIENQPASYHEAVEILEAIKLACVVGDTPYLKLATDGYPATMDGVLLIHSSSLVTAFIMLNCKHFNQINIPTSKITEIISQSNDYILLNYNPNKDTMEYDQAVYVRFNILISIEILAMLDKLSSAEKKPQFQLDKFIPTLKRYLKQMSAIHGLPKNPLLEVTIKPTDEAV